MNAPLPPVPRASVTWPMVALAGLVLGAFVAIFALIPASDPTGRSALLAVVIAAGNGLVLYFVSKVSNKQSDALERTQKMVNGHTSAILSKIPDAIEREEAAAEFRRLTGQ